MFEGYRDANASKVSLQDRLQKMAGEPFSLEETFTVLTQLGQALCYAHECDVTHGNLKPETILFNENGQVLLAEFFLHALAKDPDGGAASEAFQYRAPELLPDQVTKLGDQYALGYIAYEMLTGHKPFLVASVSKPGTFYRTKMPIFPKHFNPALSLASEEAILKAIAKEPAQRHRDISCFLTALGIPADTANQATSVDAIRISLVSGPSEQADALLQAPAKYAMQDAETFPATDASVSGQSVYPAQTSVPVEEVDTRSMDALIGTNAEAGYARQGQSLGPLQDERVPEADADYGRQGQAPSLQAPASQFAPMMDALQSPDNYAFAHHLFVGAAATDPEISLQTSAQGGPLSTKGAKLFLKWRWIGVVATCLVVVCIMATSFLTLYISRSAQEHKAIPAIDTKIDPSSPTPTAILTPTPEATATPEQGSPIAPLPTATAEPTATVQQTPTPTLPSHGRGHH